MTTDVQTATGNWGHWSGDNHHDDETPSIYNASLLTQGIASTERASYANGNQNLANFKQASDGTYRTSRQMDSIRKDLSFQLFDQERNLTRLAYEQQGAANKEFANMCSRFEVLEKSALTSQLKSAQESLARVEQNQALAAQTAAIVAAIKALIPTPT